MTEYYRVGNFNSKCKECKLSTGYAVTGQSEVPIEEVRLIIISAYPGRNEVKEGISLAAKKTDKSISAGYFLRQCIGGLMNKDDVPDHLRDFYKYIYATNAIKCEKRNNNVSDSHVNTCYKTWLKDEIDFIPKNVPILLAAGEAFKALFPKQGGLYKNRRRQDLQYLGRPCIVTFNPIEWERNALKIVTEKTISKAGIEAAVTEKLWHPYPVGSMLWHVSKDLQDIKRLVLDYEFSK